MGMEGKLRQITEFELAAYRKDPAHPQGAEAIRRAPVAGFLEMQKQLQAIMSENPSAQAAVAGYIGISDCGKQLGLHKSWHCLHFLLTGRSWDAAEPPLGNAITGGTELPDRGKVMGYGPARYLTPKQVGEVAAALAGFPAEERATAFDPEVADQQKVYVPHHDKEELLYYFGLLRDFYQDAAANGSVVLWVE